MRLIDADALEDKFGCSDADILAKEEIRDAPTIDAVPIVRCKDYKHEYIERANLAERIKYYITHTPEDSGEHYAWSIALNEVLNCPTADVVPVVRCKDCQRWDTDPDTYGSDYGPKGLCRKFFETTTCDDFCSYGESADEGANNG